MRTAGGRRPRPATGRSAGRRPKAGRSSCRTCWYGGTEPAFAPGPGQPRSGGRRRGTRSAGLGHWPGPRPDRPEVRPHVVRRSPLRFPSRTPVREPAMSAMLLLDQVAAAIHLLSAAAWFGALVYRAFFVDPKALRFFGGGAGYERFSLDLAHGMRAVVLAALLTCGLSGFV